MPLLWPKSDENCREVPEDFCKKCEESGMQRRFYCNVCACLIESVSALREHAAGAKHARNRAKFDPYQKKGGGEGKNMKVQIRCPFIQSNSHHFSHLLLLNAHKT